ncbi:MAG TPA: cytochrome c3 family protein [Desulfomonilaceae bacterium]|nr:cytochrome c3 family protein [Desulfomonilaceae bacterium]
MKKGRVFLALILGIAVLAAFTLAYAATKAPDKDVTIHSADVFKETKQSPVSFSHTKHKEAKCTDCHHEFKDGKNVWQEGQEVKKCSACHKLEAEGKVVKLEKAYHDKCVTCHKNLKKENKKTGPTACNKCHPKKDGAPEAK